MNMSVLLWINLALTLSSGLIAGVFLTFSDFVMRGLNASTTKAGVEAMQMINRVIYQSVFMFLFIGMAIASALIVGYALWRGMGPATLAMLAGALIYLLGVLVVTGTLNVPMNNVLDQLEPSSSAAADYWLKYFTDWTRWNHVRTVSSIVATACFMMGVVQLAEA